MTTVAGRLDQDPGLPRRIARGDRICRRVTRRHARTFYLASHCLPRDVRRHAYAVYGFCRWADNGVDEARSPAEAADRVGQAREALARAYANVEVPDGLAAFRRTIRERAVPKRLFDHLLDGMEMDLTIREYPDANALDGYCYRVAGVVGLMMAHVFGFRDRRCLPHAVELGHAMQLTNILRDVGEDFRRGRVYLPRDAMARHGVDDRTLADGRVTDPFRALIREQIARARELYRSSEAGVPDLIGRSSRWTVRVMAANYARILDAIERLDYDVLSRRAQVATAAKLGRVVACAWTTWTESPGTRHA